MKKQPLPRMVYFGKVVDHSGGCIDQGCLIYFKGPASYTGEDVVELHVHSNPGLLQSVLSAAMVLGARLALGGEFTRRAFVHGKMDLAKAEAVIDLIDAKGPRAAAVALSHLQGKLSTHIDGLRRSLLPWLEQVEGSIDFPEEVPGIHREQFAQVISENKTELDRILAIQDFGEIVQSGVRVLIVGRPNVGKSSLLNVILERDRAIVSDIPGTTRDFIEATITIGGVQFHLTDTAGIRDTTNAVEAMGIAKVESLFPNAHLVLWVVDSTSPDTNEDHLIRSKIAGHPQVAVVANKWDIATQDMKTAVKGGFDGWKILPVSALLAEGIHSLRQHLRQQFVEKLSGVSTDLLCNARQIGCLMGASRDLQQILETLAGGFEDDMVVFDLKSAIVKLGELTGAEITEEVLDGIFARFCVGK